MVYPKPSGGFEWTQAPWGTVLRCRPLLEAADHLFTAHDLVLRGSESEWAAVAGAMGVECDRLLLVRQVHRVDVAVARRDRVHPWVRPEADVIVSDDPSSAIGVRVADCAPVLLADRRTHAVAAAHAGWRGTVQRAATMAVEALQREFGSNARDLIAAIGPCLGPCCGEVGDEVVQAFRDAGHDSTAIGRWFSAGPSGRSHVDLWRANADQLEAAGVPPDQIHVARLCTKTHADVLHSYRVLGTAAGRMVGVIRSVHAERDPGLGIRDSGLGTRDSGLGTRDSGFGARDSGLGTRDSDDVASGFSRKETRGSRKLTMPVFPAVARRRPFQDSRVDPLPC